MKKIAKGQKVNLCMVEMCVSEADEMVHYLCAGFGERDGICKFQIVGIEHHCAFAAKEMECLMCTNLEAAKDAITRVVPLFEKAQHKMVIFERQKEAARLKAVDGTPKA